MFKKKTSRLLGVDISSTSVKIVEISKHGGRHRVEAFGVSPLPMNAVAEKTIKDIEAVGEAITVALKRSGTKLREAAVAVASSAVISKVLALDGSLGDEEMEVHVEMEASRFIPYPMNEVSIDYEILGINQEDKSLVDILVVATRLENVESRVDALELAGISAKLVDVESNAVERASGLILDQLPDKGVGKTIALVDIGATMTTFNVLHNRENIFNREEVFGGRQLTEEIQRHYDLTYAQAGLAKKQGGLPDDYIPEVLTPFKEAIVPQIRRFLQFFFAASSHDKVDQIIMVGGSSCIPDIANLVEERLDVKTEVGNPFASMVLAPKVHAARLSEDAPALMISCGLALGAERSDYATY